MADTLPSPCPRSFLATELMMNEIGRSRLTVNDSTRRMKGRDNLVYYCSSSTYDYPIEEVALLPHVGID